LSRQANPKLIGAFVLGAIALILITVFMFGSGKLFKHTITVVMYFQGSVNGLDVGAPVKLRGVTLGRVSRINLVYDTRRDVLLIPVVAELEPSLLVTDTNGNIEALHGVEAEEAVQQGVARGLRAQLVPLSLLTGKLFIELANREDTPATRVSRDPRVLEIPTIPSTADQILEVVRTAAKRFNELPYDEIVRDIEQTLAAFRQIASSPKIPNTLDHVNVAAQKLEGILSQLDTRLEGVMNQLDRTLVAGASLANSLNAQVDPISSELRDAIEGVAALTQNLDDQVQPVSEATLALLGSARRAAESATGLLDGNDPLGFEVYRTLRELSQAARSLRILAQYLERHPDALLRGKSRTGAR
jgi:paraquat-inducible protein B